MLLGALSSIGVESDDVRQRLEDAEASLNAHVVLCADLAEQVEAEKKRAASLEKQVQGYQHQLATLSPPPSEPPPPAPPPPPPSAILNHEALLRALNGPAGRSLQRTVLTAWRTHCDKTKMLSNMRGTLNLLPRCHPAAPPPPPAPAPAPAAHGRSCVAAPVGLPRLWSSSSYHQSWP